jgi:hypothetical protein
MKKSFTQCFLIKAPIMVKKNYYKLKYGKKNKKIQCLRYLDFEKRRREKDEK